MSTTQVASSAEENRARLETILAEREIDYWDIVWGQFKKDRTSVLGLLTVLLLFVAAIFAPVIACHVPYAYQIQEDDGTTRLELPWHRYLMTMDAVDKVFNIGMFLLPPWFLVVLAGAPLRRKQLRDRQILLLHVLVFGVVLAGAVAYSVLEGPNMSRDGNQAPLAAGERNPANGWIGISFQVAFLFSLAWAGQGFVSWQLGHGRRSGKRHLLAQVGAFLLALTIGSIVLVQSTIPVAKRGNVLHPTYDLKDIDREDVLRSESFEGDAFWPPVRHSYIDQDRENAGAKPGVAGHLLGTNPNGYDVLSQLLYGARTALTIGFVAVAIYMVIGTILGALAGYFGGVVDMVISRFIEIMITFPSFFLILVLVGLLQNNPEVRRYVPPIFLIMIVIGVVSWTHEARLIRGEFLRLRNREFVLAARALGVPAGRIIFRHILPNAVGPALVAATFGIGSAILTEGALSFLGIGIQPPVPSWGKMLRDGYDTKFLFLLSPPTFMILITVMAYNLVGEGLRDSLDPHLRK